ncbi:MAG: S24 family peptidase [Alphaproteobacteria bacterium]|jgi:DNA-binding transcriptional regulator YiaG|nr:S24 family peptidase [Alphaproteobacteria bacterium]
MMKMSDTPTTEEKDPNKPLTVGERFRLARELSPLSRKAFCTKYGLNWYTVQSWELRRNFSRGVNLTKFCQALAEEGIVCTEDWLIEGIGPTPYLESSREAATYVPPITSRQLKKQSPDLLKTLIQEEIALFCDHSQQIGRKGVAIQITDEAMAPDYEVGEFIGALNIPLDQIHLFHQVICLVEASPNHFLVRRLLKEGEAYILLATNKDYPLIRLEEIASLSEVVWRRRGSTI